MKIPSSGTPDAIASPRRTAARHYGRGRDLVGNRRRYDEHEGLLTPAWPDRDHTDSGHPPSATIVLDDVLRQQGISSAWYVDGAHGCAISGNGAAGGLIEQRLAYFGRDYPWLVETLDQIGPPSNQLIAPYPQGRQAPAPDSTPMYDVDAPADDPAEEMRALVDALSFHARWMAEEQTRLLGIDWRSTTAFGGPTRIDGWMTRKALASGGREFAVVQGEATAAEGAALVAEQVITGQIPEPLEAQQINVPEQLAAKWNGQFQRWLP